MTRPLCLTGREMCEPVVWPVIPHPAIFGKFSGMNLSVRVACIVLMMGSIARANKELDRSAWMKGARFGVMNHYLEDWIARREKIPGGKMTVEQWNDMVGHFDVELHAKQIESTGAKYQIFTIGQNSGFYVSPNSAYDRIVGVTPS